MSDITLYGASGSPFVRKVQIALREKGLAYEHVPTIPVTSAPDGVPFPWITPDLRPHTPLTKIPFIRFADRWLADSSVILAYLDRIHPQETLYPSEPWEHARALWFEEFIDSGAYPKLFSTIVFERVLAPLLLNRPTDQAVVGRAIAEDLPTVYEYLDREIGSRTFLVGERFTIADLTTASFFVSMQQANAGPDPRRWENLARYVQEQLRRPSIIGLLKE